MVDKRTMHDDARGMGEGVLDSRLTRHRYTLIMEPKKVADPVSGAVQDQVNNMPKFGVVGEGNQQTGSTRSSSVLPFLSTLGLILSRYLEHPVSTLVYTDGDGMEVIDDSGKDARPAIFYP
jgi:hypothetical protein